MGKVTKIYSGTSGFAYREWRGSFYPADIAPAAMLSYYSERLSAVEVNSTFHRMPTRRLMEQWGGQVSGPFRFALKAPALITHRKKLINVEEETAVFLDAASMLGKYLGPLLFQLPPWLHFDLQLLERFLPLTAGFDTAFEFRNPSWFQYPTYRLLEQFGSALCISDREEIPEPPLVRTARFGYLRLRRNDYDVAALNKWRKRVDSQGWDTAFIFFRHEETGKGASMALGMPSDDGGIDSPPHR